MVASDHLEGKLSGEDLEMIHIIQNAGDRASQLTRQLFDFSHKGKLISTSVDIHDIMKNTSQMLRQILDRSITLELDIQAENHHVTGDDNQIMNSLINMAINSSHAMPDGGKLIFSTSNVFLNEEYCEQAISDLTPGEYIRIDITDNGTGIHPEKLPRIFDPFFTTKKQGEGTGLGLAAVKGMVESHRGTLTVYSELGKGTSFQIYLPINEERDKQEKHNNNIQIGGGQHILVIDDEDIIRVTAKVMLENLNYRVTAVPNGEEGLLSIGEDKPSLVILDMIMPGMNGRDVFRKIRETDPDLPILLASGFSKDSDVRELREHNLSGFIRKPYTKQEISHELKRILG